MPIGYIYEITSNDKSITGLYIGSCWDMEKRLEKHAINCYNENDKRHYNNPVYKYIRENGDFHTFNMTVIDSGECEDRTELRCAEQFYIDMEGGIENLLNDRDALLDKQKREIQKSISRVKSSKKNIETQRFPCKTCGFYFPSDSKLQKHLGTPKHAKNLTKEASGSTK
tara:strand:- start:13 stop:519 length:507 start_codon:yes stop_codon:yes gene_type:complete